MGCVLGYSEITLLSNNRKPVKHREKVLGYSEITLLSNPRAVVVKLYNGFRLL